MKYIIRVWIVKDRKPKVEYIEESDLAEAQAYADYIAEDAKAHGYEYDVTIYEITSY